ncbi:MAG: PE family protein [Mycobacterium sp.]|nr:PE family protein [Mycobacterium sp.]
MSFLITHPETLSAAAGALAGIGDGMVAQNGAAAGPTGAVTPAAADVVSAMAAAQFATHAQLYQQVAGQAAIVHQQLVATLRTNGGAYAATEAANVTAAG